MGNPPKVVARVYSPIIHPEKAQLDASLPGKQRRVLTKVSFSLGVDFTATFLNSLRSVWCTVLSGRHLEGYTPAVRVHESELSKMSPPAHHSQ